MKSNSVLFLSNGHGEDTINCQILKALKAACPDIDVSAVSIVGDGSAYKRSGVLVVGLTSKMPSGGVFYYEGRVNLGLSLRLLLASPKCLAVFTRDALTAADLNRQGLKQAEFAGNPVMDDLISTGKDVQLMPGVRTIALLELRVDS